MEHKKITYGDMSMPIGIGPYFFLNSNRVDYNQRNLFDTLPDLAYRIYNNEDRQLRLKRDVLPGKCLPSSFSAVRPGPREDPGIRDYFRNYYLGGSKTMSAPMKIIDDPFLFAFNSYEQLKRWFFDDKEFKLLEDNEFTVVKRRVKKTNIIDGHAQILWKIKSYHITQKQAGQMTLDLK